MRTYGTAQSRPPPPWQSDRGGNKPKANQAPFDTRPARPTLHLFRGEPRERAESPLLWSWRRPLEPDPGHAGEGTGNTHAAPTPAPPSHGSPTMNKPISAKDVAPPKVTTGPFPGSRKVYSAPQGHDDVAVPLREIGLAEGASFRVHDTSGPYSDPDASIDLQRGLLPLRTPWVEARGSVEVYAGRVVRPEDNGAVAASHLARPFAGERQPMRGIAGAPVTQLELARAGIVTKERIYV